MRLPTPLIIAIQKSLDKIVSFDDNLSCQLTPMEGKVIRFQLQGLDTDFWIFVIDNQIEVSGFFDGEVDTTISGTPIALASMSKDLRPLFNGDVDISGDLELGLKIKKVIESIDIDWEEQLSHLVGDSVAHQASRIYLSLTDWLNRSSNTFSQNLSDYVKDEIELVAAHSDIHNFCADVDVLRASVDRLEARLSAVENGLLVSGK